ERRCEPVGAEPTRLVRRLASDRPRGGVERSDVPAQLLRLAGRLAELLRCVPHRHPLHHVTRPEAARRQRPPCQRPQRSITAAVVGELAGAEGDDMTDEVVERAGGVEGGGDQCGVAGHYTRFMTVLARSVTIFDE